MQCKKLYFGQSVIEVSLVIQPESKVVIYIRWSLVPYRVEESNKAK